MLRLPSGDFGFVLFTAGIGALIGGVATPPLARRFGRPLVLTCGAAFSAITMGLMALTRHGVLAAVLFALSASGVMVWNVLTMSLRQALIPPELFGRVQGAYRTLVWGAIPLGAIVGGALASLVGIRTVFAVAGLVSLVLAGLLGRLLHQHADALRDDPTPAVDLALA
ncbi:MAG: hypothetical protein QOJ78_2272 [Pseudonocardiales bacterium]|nr:hypothetical protein [Pseudonocardiales bacterium]